MLGDAQQGQTVSVRVGQRFEVVLGSTYWTFDPPSDPSVVQGVVAPAYSPSPGCVPGGGCGTATAEFVAVGPGQATLSASRTSCGEALACGPASGSYKVTVVVTR